LRGQRTHRDCGQPSIAGSATAKRCAECHRIDHNKRQAAHMARKRKDPQFREADRERVRISESVPGTRQSLAS